MKTSLPLSDTFARTTLALAAATFGFASLAPAADVVGSGHVISETRAVSGFHGVDLDGSGTVILTQDGTEGLVIEAEDNLLPLIDSTVDAHGILRLGFKKHTGSIESKKDVVYKLSAKTMDDLAVDGSGSIRAAGELAAAKAGIALRGSGGIRLDRLKADSATVELSGSGDVKLVGTARRLTLEIDGSGDYAGRDLKADEASVSINGSGGSSVWADKTLSVTINGSGEVRYCGGATVTQSINGSGTVHPLGAKNAD